MVWRACEPFGRQAAGSLPRMKKRRSCLACPAQPLPPGWPTRCCLFRAWRRGWWSWFEEKQPMARILLVEDSPTQAHRLAFILEDAGFQVEMAPDADSGFARLAQERFD